MNERNLSIDRVLNIEVPETELLRRAKKRAESYNGIDDKYEQTYVKRIKIFKAQTKPVIIYMKTLIKVDDFDGLGHIESITDNIKSRSIND